MKRSEAVVEGRMGGKGTRGTEFAVQKRSMGLRQEGFAAASEGRGARVDGGVGKCSAAPRCAQYYV